MPEGLTFDTVQNKSSVFKSKNLNNSCETSRYIIFFKILQPVN